MSIVSTLAMRDSLIPMLERDTLEARVLRAEALCRAAWERTWSVENELKAIDRALTAEHAPREADGVALTRMGRIRRLGDMHRRTP